MEKLSLFWNLGFLNFCYCLLNLKKESVLTKAMVENNYETEGTTKYEFSSVKQLGENMPSNYVVYTTSQHGMFAVIRDNNEYNYYLYCSATDTLLPNKLYSSNFSENRLYNDYGEFVVVSEYRNSNRCYVLYDMFGNQVFSQDNSFYISSSSQTNGLSFEIYLSSTGTYQTVVYDNQGGSLTGTNYVIGDIVSGGTSILDLKVYGYPGYKAILSGLDAKIEVGGSIQHEFSMPLTTPTFIVDKYIYFWQKFSLPEDSNDYDYSIDEYKYSSSLVRVDFTNGKVEEVDVPYYCDFRYVRPLKDENGFYKYLGLEAREITDKKVVNGNYALQFIADAKLDLHDDVTGLGSIMYVTDDSGKEVIVDKTNFKVYSTNLTLINDFSSVATAFYPNAKVFIGRKDSSYGLFNLKGEVVVPFEYSSLKGVLQNKAYGVKSDKTYLINFSTTNPSSYSISEIQHLSSISSMTTGEIVLKYSDNKIIVQDGESSLVRLSLINHNSFSTHERVTRKSNSTCYTVCSAYNTVDAKDEYYLLRHTIVK